MDYLTSKRNETINYEKELVICFVLWVCFAYKFQVHFDSHVDDILGIVQNTGII